MKATMLILLLTSVVTITTTLALAQPLPGKRHRGDRLNDRSLALDHHRPLQYGAVEVRRDGYLPDYRLCFPGACRDNPYY